ncbi:recombinase family protein [Streptomyces microflavus]|uniref:recombinase family protein n=1 Tax=Streptomyces microflavus TaxID=1919 RepID=UPI0033A327CE
MSRRLRSAVNVAAGPTRAVIYVRISQDRTGAHLGVDRQREDCEALAERNDWDVVEVYVDNDVSAYSGKKRPRYQQMLTDLDDGLATVVIAWHTDRLHRNLSELEAYMALSRAKGVVTHTVKTGLLDLASASGQLTAGMLGTIARYESAHKAERVAAARRQKAKAGQWAGGIRPFGWGVETGKFRTKTEKVTDPESGEQSVIETEVPVLDMTKLVPEEGAALEVGSDMILSGGSIRGWVRWLADKGLLSTTGKAIEPPSARDLLLRPRNAGIAIYQGEEIGRGLWEPAVSEPKFRAVVAILTNPDRVTTTGSQPRWLGSLIYRCGRAGCTSTARCTKVGGSKQPSYRCQADHGGGRHADRLDRYIVDLLVERLSQPDAVDLLEPAPDGINAAALQLESEQIRRRLTDLAGMFGSGQITMAQFTEGSDTARAQLEGVTSQLARAAVTDPLVGLVGVPDVRAAWEACDLGRQRTVLRALLDVTLHPPRPGRMPDGGYFDYDAIETRWKR